MAPYKECSAAPSLWSLGIVYDMLMTLKPWLVPDSIAWERGQRTSSLQQDYFIEFPIPYMDKMINPAQFKGGMAGFKMAAWMP